MQELLEARQKYKAGLIVLGEYLALIDQFLDAVSEEEVGEGDEVEK
jgi:hypothetical protein